MPVPNLPVGLRPVEPGNGQQQNRQYASQSVAQSGRPDARVGKEGRGERGQETERQDHHNAIEPVRSQHARGSIGFRQRQQGEEAGADHRQGEALEAVQAPEKRPAKVGRTKAMDESLFFVSAASARVLAVRTSQERFDGLRVGIMTASR